MDNQPSQPTQTPPQAPTTDPSQPVTQAPATPTQPTPPVSDPSTTGYGQPTPPVAQPSQPVPPAAPAAAQPYAQPGAARPGRGLRIAGGVLQIILGSLISLTALAMLLTGNIYGLMDLVFGLYWVFNGVRTLTLSDQVKAAKVFRESSIAMIAYAVLTLVGAILVTNNYISVILPTLFAAVCMTLSIKYSKIVKG